MPNKMNLHPIIHEYVTTEKPLLQILEKLYDKNNFLEVTFLKVVQAIRTLEDNEQIF